MPKSHGGKFPHTFSLDPFATLLFFREEPAASSMLCGLGVKLRLIRRSAWRKPGHWGLDPTTGGPLVL